MRFWTISILLAPAIPMMAVHLSAQDTVPDSNRTFSHPTVLVEGSRLVQSSATTLGAVSRLAGWSMRRLDGRTIDAVLGEEGGLFIRDVGGAGGVKTVSIRGSAANQTVILFNGMRLNSPQNGLVDLGLYPVDLFDAVDVVRGGQSALYGPDAMAGTVMLSSGSRGAAGVRIGLNAGSFGGRGGSVLWNAKGSRAESSVRGGFDRSDGTFSFPWSVQSKIVQRTRDGGSTLRVFASGSVLAHVSSATRVEATILGVRADRGSPGPVTSAASMIARLRDELAHVIVRAFGSRGPSESWEAGVSGSFQDEEYEDLSVPQLPVDRYANRVASSWLQWQGALFNAVTGGIGVEVTTARLDGRSIPTGTRRHGGAVLTGLRWTVDDLGLKVLPMVRWDMFSDLEPQASPRVAFEVPVRDDGSLVLRASVGSGFRMPNFNELYWLPGGNPLLRPERALTADAGGDFRFPWLGEQHLVAGLFVADTRDRITGWPPVNTSRTFSRGAELNWSWSSAAHRLWGTGTFASVERREAGLRGRQVPYLPRLTAAAGVDLLLGPVTVSPGIRYVSRRYTTSDNSAALSMAPSARTSFHVQAGFALWGQAVELQGGVENVFDVAEVSLPGYPLPGRSYTVRVTMNVWP